MSLDQTANGFDVEVIVVIMADQDDIYGWKIVKIDAGLVYSARTSKGDRTNTILPHGVRQDIEASRLNQRGCLANE